MMEIPEDNVFRDFFGRVFAGGGCRGEGEGGLSRAQ